MQYYYYYHTTPIHHFHPSCRFSSFQLRPSCIVYDCANLFSSNFTVSFIFFLLPPPPLVNSTGSDKLNSKFNSRRLLKFLFLRQPASHRVEMLLHGRAPANNNMPKWRLEICFLYVCLAHLYCYSPPIFAYPPSSCSANMQLCTHSS